MKIKHNPRTTKSEYLKIGRDYRSLSYHPSDQKFSLGFKTVCLAPSYTGTSSSSGTMNQITLSCFS